MRSDFTADSIAHARRSVRAVLESSNGAELAQGASCRALLEESVMDLQAIEGHLRSGSPAAPDELRSALLGLKQDIAQIVRVVDAGLAFYRGVALRMGYSSPSYSPDGRIAEEATAIGLRGMQG
jgi:hypothetical protein